MARIRSIKPDFFRHEALQELEKANPGACCMLVFAALWGHCDKAGRFEWKPRYLKLDILPWLPFEMAETLDLLHKAGFILRYRAGGKEYGEIPSFVEHQRISGNEAKEPAKHPEPTEYHSGSTDEASEKRLVALGREGNGVQEEEGKGDTGAGAPDPVQIAFDEFNELAEQTGLPRANQLTSSRRRAIKARLAECDGIEGWRHALGKIRGSPFLTGQNDRSWRASLDFLVTASKFNKIMDGAYDGQVKRSEWDDIARAAAGDWDMVDTPRLVGGA